MRDPWKQIMKNVELSSEHIVYVRNRGETTVIPPKKTRQPITITIQDLKELWRIQNGICYWLGIDMSLEDLFVSYSPFAVSVERLDSNRGYHKDNIVLTTRFANRGRGKYDNANFKKRLDTLLENRSKDDIIIPNFVPAEHGNLEDFLN